MEAELQVEKVSLELQRVRLAPGDILAVRVAGPMASAEMLNAIQRVVANALERAGLQNQVLVMPKDLELSVVSG